MGEGLARIQMSCAAGCADASKTRQSIIPISPLPSIPNEEKASYSVGVKFSVFMLECPSLRSGNIYDPIDDDVRNVDTLRPEFSRQ